MFIKAFLVVIIIIKPSLSVYLHPVKAYGRDATLGQLYDARTNTFLPYSIVNVPEQEIPTNVLQILNNHRAYSRNYQTPPEFPGGFESLIFINEDDIIERLEILCDYIQPKGAAEFFKEGPINPKSSILFKILETDTRIVRLQLQYTDFEQFVNKRVLELDLEATHIVQGIYWGRDSSIFLEDTTTGNQIQYYPYVYDILNNSPEPDPRDPNITVKIFTDIPPPPGSGYPKNVKELRGNLNNLHKYQFEYTNRLGVKKLYEMVEIDLARKILRVDVNISSPSWKNMGYNFYQLFNSHPLNIFERLNEFKGELANREKRLDGVEVDSGFQRNMRTVLNETKTELETYLSKYKIELMEYINLSRSKTSISSTLMESLNQIGGEIQTLVFDRQVFKEFDYKVGMYNFLTEKDIIYCMDSCSIINELRNNFTALILSVNEFIQNSTPSTRAWFYFLENVTGRKVMIDCDYPVQNQHLSLWCLVGFVEPVIAVVENRRVVKIIKYE